MKIKSYEKPHLDNQNQPTIQIMQLDPATGDVHIVQRYQSEMSSTLSTVWHGITYEFQMPYYTQETLETIDQKLIDDICGNHEVFWNGHNQIGRVRGDGIAAMESLEVFFANDFEFGQMYAVWSADDWYQNYEGTDLSMTIDEEVEATAPEDEISDCIVIVDGAEEYLENLRNETTDEIREKMLDRNNQNWYVVDYTDGTTLVKHATGLSNILECGMPMEDYGIKNMQQCGL